MAREKQADLPVPGECGFESAKWMGKCPGCGEWNSFEEAIKEPVPCPKRRRAGHWREGFRRPTPISEISTVEEARYHTGLSELDRVLGGGIVKGLAHVLISGDPGIGKSTMLLQICEHLGQSLADPVRVRGGIQPGRSSCGPPGWGCRAPTLWKC